MHLPPRWVLAISFGVAAAILGDSLLYAVLPTQWSQLGLEVGMVGVLLSANRFVRLASNPVAGWVMNRWGVRVPFLISVFVAAGTTIAYASGLGFIALVIARAVWGICWSFLRLGGYLVALEAASGSNRGYYLGFFNAIVRFGSFIATLTGGLLTDLLGFGTTVLLFAGASILGGIGILRERPTIKTHASVLPKSAVPAPVHEATSNLLADQGTLSADLPPSRRLWIVYTGALCHGMVISGLATATLGLWLLTLYGSTIQMDSFSLGVATVTGVLLSSRFICDFFWGPIAGHLSDRFGRWILILFFGIFEAGSFLALSLANGLLWTAGASLALAISATAFQVTLDATAGDIAPPAQRARTLSWYATWIDLGAAIGPLVGFLLGAGIGLEWLYRGASLLVLFVGMLYVVTFRLLPGAQQAKRAIHAG